MSESSYVQYIALRLDPAWRHLPTVERERWKNELVAAVEQSASQVTTHSYSALGFKPGADLVLWRMADSLEILQETLGPLLLTRLGSHMEISQSLLGMIRPSPYARRSGPSGQAAVNRARSRYLVVYPFVKTTEWYRTNQETRQALMNEHMRIGHGHPSVHQLLAYSFGIDDQEFIVAYETDDLADYQAVVMELRETEARCFTLRDTPVLTYVHRPLAETLSLLG